MQKGSAIFLKVQEKAKQKTPPQSAVLEYEQQVKYMKITVEEMQSRLEKMTVTKGLKTWAYILHDLDTDGKGGLKAPHYHVIMIFDKRKDINSIAKQFDDEPERVIVRTKDPKTGKRQSIKTASDNALAYLCHETSGAKAEGKHVYPPEKVKANFDYIAWAKEHFETMGSPKDIVELVGTGDLTFKQAKQRLLDEFGMYALSHNLKVLSDGAKVYNDKIYENWQKRMKEEKHDVKVIWIYGFAGTGKSHFATYWADDEGLTYKRLTSKHLFDDLRDLSIEEQDVLIFDDFRPNTLPYSSILQIFDPLNVGVSLDARYYNAYLMSEFIIVTTPFSPYEFYQTMHIRNRKVDTFEQLSRRISVTFRFTPEDIYVVEPKIQRYVDNLPIYKYVEIGESSPNVWSQIVVDDGKKRIRSLDELHLVSQNAICRELKKGQKKSSAMNEKTDENEDIDAESENLPF